MVLDRKNSDAVAKKGNATPATASSSEGIWPFSRYLVLMQPPLAFDHSYW